MRQRLVNLQHKKITSYTKSILIFIASIITLLLLALYMNQVSIGLVRDELYHSQMANLEFYESTLNDEFMVIYEQQKRLIENSIVQKLVYADAASPNITYEQYESISKISEELKTLGSYNSNIRECGLYIPALDMIINNISFLDRQDTAQAQEILSYAAYGNGYITITTDNRLVFYTAQPVNQTEKAVIIYTVMDSDKMTDTLRRINPKAVNILSNKDFSLRIANSEVSEPLAQFFSSNMPADTGSGIREENIGGEAYWVISAPLRPFGLVLSSCVAENDVTGNLQFLNTLYYILIGICLVLIVLFILSMQRIIYRPIEKLMTAFDQLDKGNLDTKIAFSRKDEFGYLYNFFNMMTEDLKITFQQMCEQAVSLQKAELSQLYLQIHPHFLYNCFFNISNLCNTGEYEKVKQFTKRLGSYYRYITYGDERLVNFMHEYQHMKNYIAIQKIRFGDRIQADVGPLPQWAEERKVPKIILQPIVENAYKYACEPRLEGGMIRIRAGGEDGVLCVTVEDNGQALTDEALQQLQQRLNDSASMYHEGGLINVHKRLQLYFGEKSGLAVRRSELGGMKVTMRIEGERRDDLAVSDFTGR